MSAGFLLFLALALQNRLPCLLRMHLPMYTMTATFFFTFDFKKHADIQSVPEIERSDIYCRNEQQLMCKLWMH